MVALGRMGDGLDVSEGLEVVMTLLRGMYRAEGKATLLFRLVGGYMAELTLEEANLYNDWVRDQEEYREYALCLAEERYLYASANRPVAEGYRDADTEETEIDPAVRAESIAAEKLALEQDLAVLNRCWHETILHRREALHARRGGA